MNGRNFFSTLLFVLLGTFAFIIIFKVSIMILPYIFIAFIIFVIYAWFKMRRFKSSIEKEEAAYRSTRDKQYSDSSIGGDVIDVDFKVIDDEHISNK